MGEMDDNVTHVMCQEKMKHQQLQIDSLKDEIRILKENGEKIKVEFQDLKIQQIKDGEKVIALYNVMGEIKDQLKNITDKLDNSISKHKDSFKDFAYGFGVDLIKYGIMAGVIYAVLNNLK